MPGYMLTFKILESYEHNIVSHLMNENIKAL